MQSTLIAAGTAFWLGLLTAISPCPLATNIAAISYLGKQLGSTRRVLLSGLLYGLGRILAYIGVGMVTIAGILSIPGVSFFLQENMGKALGPILILSGIFVMGLVPLRFPDWISGERAQRVAEKGGIWGSGLLGILFALSFCPVSAGLFFGSLIPLSIRHGSRILMPTVYGLGTGLPVIVFAVLAALGAQAVGKVFNRLSRFELWARRITGAVFILVGIYYCLIYIFKVIE